MSNLVVIGFDDPADAFELRAALARMQAQYLHRDGGRGRGHPR